MMMMMVMMMVLLIIDDVFHGDCDNDCGDDGDFCGDDVVVVVVEYNINYIYIYIIVGASVPRPVENLLCFTAHSLPYELKTIVLASRALG